MKERTWHKSQQFRDKSDGWVVMMLNVSDDYALRSWILGFGRRVRVLGPAALVEWAVDELDATREQYGDDDGRIQALIAEARSRLWEGR